MFRYPDIYISLLSDQLFLAVATFLDPRNLFDFEQALFLY